MDTAIAGTVPFEFACAGDRGVGGEATPSYPRAPHAIRAFNPKARIFIILRNPVDVMHSLHGLALYSRERLTDSKSALEENSERRGPEHIGSWRVYGGTPSGSCNGSVRSHRLGSLSLL